MEISFIDLVRDFIIAEGVSDYVLPSRRSLESKETLTVSIGEEALQTIEKLAQIFNTTTSNIGGVVLNAIVTNLYRDCKKEFRGNLSKSIRNKKGVSPKKD